MCMYVYVCVCYVCVSDIHELLRGASAIFCWGQPLCVTRSTCYIHVVIHCMQHFLQGTANAASSQTAIGDMGYAAILIAFQPHLLLNTNHHQHHHHQHGSWAHILWALSSWPRISESRVYGSRVSGPRLSGSRANGWNSGPSSSGPRFSGPRSSGPRFFMLNTFPHHMSCNALQCPTTTKVYRHDRPSARAHAWFRARAARQRKRMMKQFHGTLEEQKAELEQLRAEQKLGFNSSNNCK